MALDGVADRLKDRHDRLDVHFRQLREIRGALASKQPVFALEHALSDNDLNCLKADVRTAIAAGFHSKFWRNGWLPFVVYATEIGYEYVGDEFWSTFQNETPGWTEHGDRGRIRDWFRRFGQDYGGAVPEGAFARNFSIISWPITHSVLPVYLQRNLARLLFDFRMGITADLLGQPDRLGEKLAARASGYTERFRLFTENTSLLGHIAVSLLQGEGEESAYLLKSTLVRLVEGLEREREAKEWLNGARRAASHARTRGFFPTDHSDGGESNSRERVPKSTDPRLVLRNMETGWRLYAQLPDLTSLSVRLPSIYSELTERRARVEGADQSTVARGRLATANQEVLLARWPDPDKPFIQLEDGDSRTNLIIREQVMITRGPIWLFKRRGRGLAVEVRGKHVRAGGTYYVAHTGSWKAPIEEWATVVRSDVSGADVVRLRLPGALSPSESATLVEAGLSVVSQVTIQPVGFPIRAWDGEGTAEWLAGEPVLIGIHVEQIPSRIILEVAGRLRDLPWPVGEQVLLLLLDDLPTGAHVLQVVLGNEQKQMVAQGEFAIGVRDPLNSVAEAGIGEGIRLLVSPPRPKMKELWEPGAVTILGPPGLKANLKATLRDEGGRELVSSHREVALPKTDSEWIDIAESLQESPNFTLSYEQAESVELTVSHAGVGFASVVADRGFQPLRWKLKTKRQSKSARLMDRTDSGGTTVELFMIESPLTAESYSPDAEVPVPDTGGLLHARAGEGIDAEATLLLPTDPNTLLTGFNIDHDIPTGARTQDGLMTLAEGYRRWAEAESPADPFSEYQRKSVLEAIARTFFGLAAGERWAAIEQREAQRGDRGGLTRDMQTAVGNGPEHKLVANKIAMRLHSWQEPESRLAGFAEAMRYALASNQLGGIESAAERLLTLASDPGSVLDWPPQERDAVLQAVLDTPFLLRAARFAWLGTRHLDDEESLIP